MKKRLQIFFYSFLALLVFIPIVYFLGDFGNGAHGCASEEVHCIEESAMNHACSGCESSGLMESLFISLQIFIGVAIIVVALFYWNKHKDAAGRGEER